MTSPFATQVAADLSRVLLDTKQHAETWTYVTAEGPAFTLRVSFGLNEVSRDGIVIGGGDAHREQGRALVSRSEVKVGLVAAGLVTSPGVARPPRDGDKLTAPTDSDFFGEDWNVTTWDNGVGGHVVLHAERSRALGLGRGIGLPR